MPVRKLISFDWAMKKLLRSKVNFDILEGFLSVLLKEQIKILEVLDSESNQEYNKDKFNRVDLKVRNDKNEIIIIEIQYDRESDYLQRILYSSSKVITEHLQSGDAYENVVKVISVNILYFDLGVGEDYVYYGSTNFKGINIKDELKLSKRQEEIYKTKEVSKLFPQYYLIKVNNFDNNAKTPLDEWIYFLKNEEIKDTFKAQGIKKAKETLDILKLSDSDRKIYEKYQDDLHYQTSIIVGNYRDGKSDGIKEGIEIGEARGRLNEKINTAKNLLKMGIPPKQVAQATGLLPEEIDKINEK